MASTSDTPRAPAVGRALPLAMAQAFAAGLLAALALPPRHWWWLLPVAFGWLLLLLDAQLRRARTRKRRIGVGAALLFAFGLGWELLGLGWITEAFFAITDQYGLFAYLAVGALAVAAALFMAAAGAVHGAGGGHEQGGGHGQGADG